MPTILLRVIIAIIAVLIIFALLLPVSRLIGLPISGDLLTVIRVCVAGGAVFYILRG